MRSSVVILTIFLYATNAEKSSFTKKYVFPECDIKTNRPGHNMTKLIFTRFNESQPNTINRCIVTMISGAFDNSTNEIRECEVSLKPEMQDGTIMHYCMAHEFNNDKVIVVWGEEQNFTDSNKQTRSVIVKTSVVDMTKNCHTVEATKRKYEVQEKNPMPMYCFHPRVIVFEDTYELLLVEKISICEPHPENCNYVLYKFDTKFGKPTEPKQWPNSLSNGTCSISYNVSPAKLPEGKQGYYITDTHTLSLATELVAEKSINQQNLQVWSQTFNKSLERYKYSLVNNAISLCETLEDLSFVCTQLDQKGQILRETKFKTKHSNESMASYVYNLRNGGLLISIWTHLTQEYLIEIDKTGLTKAIEVNFEISLPIYSFLYDLRVFENKRGQYCTVKMITKTEESKWTPVDTYVHCFSPDELSKCDDNICL